MARIPQQMEAAGPSGPQPFLCSTRSHLARSTSDMWPDGPPWWCADPV